MVSTKCALDGEVSEARGSHSERRRNCLNVKIIFIREMLSKGAPFLKNTEMMEDRSLVVQSFLISFGSFFHIEGEARTYTASNS